MSLINKVPSCCGAAIINDLRYIFHDDTEKSLEYVKKKINADHPYYSQYIIILNASQVKVLGVEIQKLGFVPVSVIKNRNSRHDLTTYIYSRPDYINTDGKVADVNKAYPEPKIVEKEVIKYSLRPDQKDKLADKMSRLTKTLTELKKELESK